MYGGNRKSEKRKFTLYFRSGSPFDVVDITAMVAEDAMKTRRK